VKTIFGSALVVATALIAGCSSSATTEPLSIDDAGDPEGTIGSGSDAGPGDGAGSVPACCAAYQGARGGPPVVLGAIQCLAGVAGYDAPVPGPIAVDGTSLYWTCPFPGTTVGRLSLAGGETSTLASAQDGTFAITVDATNVYWLDGRRIVTVMSVPLAGGPPTVLASGQNYPNSIVAYGSNVYWPTYQDTSASGTYVSNGAVMTVSSTGGGSTTLASGQNAFGDIAVDARSAYWIALSQRPTNDPNTDSTGAVMSVALTGGEPTVLASGQNGPSSLVIDATTAYWSNDPIIGTGFGISTILSVPLTGGNPTTLVTLPAQQNGSGILGVDPTSVYFTAYDEVVGAYVFMSVPLKGGTPKLVTLGQTAACKVTVCSCVDTTNIYWTTGSTCGTAMVTVL
jgi:hypothetical protein